MLICPNMAAFPTDRENDGGGMVDSPATLLKISKELKEKAKLAAQAGRQDLADKFFKKAEECQESAMMMAKLERL